MSKKQRAPKRRNIIHLHAKMKSGAGTHKDKPKVLCTECQDKGIVARDDSFVLICPQCQGLAETDEV